MTIWMLLLLSGVSTNGLLIRHWTMGFTGLKHSTGHLDLFTVKSLIQCANHCGLNSMCRSVFYVEDDKLCKIYAQTFQVTSPGLSSESSAVYYERNDPDSLTTTTTSPTTTSTTSTTPTTTPIIITTTPTSTTTTPSTTTTTSSTTTTTPSTTITTTTPSTTTTTPSTTTTTPSTTTTPTTTTPSTTTTTPSTTTTTPSTTTTTPSTTTTTPSTTTNTPSTTTTTPTSIITTATDSICPADDSFFTFVLLPSGAKFLYRVLMDMPRNHFDSETFCSSIGARMYRIITTEKFSFTQQLMACEAYSSNNFWIDGVYNTTTSQWVTRDGDQLPMTSGFWYPGKPNNPGVTNCVGIPAHAGHYFDDYYCHMARAYGICEK